MHDGFVRAAFFNLSEVGNRLTDEELGYSFYASRLVGVPRLRQLRVRGNKCSSHEALRKLVGKCYGDFSPAAESVKSYGTQDGYAVVYACRGVYPPVTLSPWSKFPPPFPFPLPSIPLSSLPSP